MEKNNNSWIFWIGLGIVLFLVFTQTDLLKPKQDSQMSVIYYDKNGNVMDWKGYEPYNYEKAMQSSMTPIINQINQGNTSAGFSIVGGSETQSSLKIFFDKIKSTIDKFLSKLKIGSFSIIPYSSQCSFASCPSGYSINNEECDDVTRTCTRECKQTIAASCGSYGSFSQVSSLSCLNKVGGSSCTTSSYSVSSTSLCYKWYGSAKFSVNAWNSDTSYKLYAYATSISASSSCFNTMTSNTKNSLTYTKGRGTLGATATASSYYSPYTDSSCGTIGSSNHLTPGTLYAYLYVSTAPWNLQQVNYDYKYCTYCTESWTCGAWSTCSGGTQTRTCTDANACGTTTTKPATSQTCTVCTPTTCSALGKQCGSWLDGCSGILNCGTCSTNYACNSTGQCEYAPTFARYQINVNNNGNVPYSNVRLTSTIPSTFLSSFPSISFSLNLGQTNNFTSSLIDISSYIGQTFISTINAFNTYTNQTQTFQSSRVIP